MTINELCKRAHENAEKKGFWEDWNYLAEQRVITTKQQMMMRNAIGNRLMLIVSELGEALEALRHDDMDNFKEELADTVIRICDLAGGLEMNLEAEIEKKMKINESRPYKHGKAF